MQAVRNVRIRREDEESQRHLRPEPDQQSANQHGGVPQQCCFASRPRYDDAIRGDEIDTYRSLSQRLGGAFGAREMSRGRVN